MRVLLMTLAPGAGGVWRHVADLATGLRERGADVSLALDPRAVDLHRRAAELELGWRPVTASLRGRVDVWHAHLHDTLAVGVLPLLAARRLRRRARVVVTEHLPRNVASDPKLLPVPKTPGAATAKAILKRSEAALVHRVITVSRGSKRFLAERYRIDGSRVRVVENGVRVGPDPGAPVPAEALRVVSIGSLSQQKGHDVLVAAVARASRSLRVRIVGEGPARGRLETQAGALPVGTIALPGWSDDPAREMLAADVVCVPSRWEASSYVALEGMALGRPVVASRVDGVEDIVSHGENGLLVPPGDPDALANALDRIAENERGRVAMGRAAHARVAERYPVGRMIDDTVAVYEELIGV